MKLQIENLGKVAITIAKDYWDISKDYDRLVIVPYKSDNPDDLLSSFATYISRKPVPAGVILADREYWIPFSSVKEEIVLDYESFKREMIDRFNQFVQECNTTIINLIEEYEREYKTEFDKLKQDANNALANAEDALDKANKALAQAPVELNYDENQRRLQLKGANGDVIDSESMPMAKLYRMPQHLYDTINTGNKTDMFTFYFIP